ncbi:PqiC family protein [Pseudoduganella umbonata]|uniref:Membrane integrity-associated transporter subunit PqiC n=1 Tax=Pseudoduganella umbonata TaxID=864828 RepID=A0A4P8HPA1_9BURK|nr:PqiC family protein [Pseudoduganella umbonata]MBB3221129.1 hypothetical protein [Pseudoduganella umbonata]QCP10322.1 membrane integrity-associated transporter subunit PqiC [Pseudoduganella umbonata]
MKRPFNARTALPALGLAAALAGCSAPPVDRFYTLAGGVPPASAPAPASTTGKLYVEMLAVNIPAQVQRNQLVVGNGAAGRVDVLDHHRWAGPLADEIGSALSLDVTSRLGAIDVYRTPAPDGAPVYRISTNVQRFESVPGSYALVDAVWSVRLVGSSTVLTCRSVLREDAGAGYEAVVAAHRAALGRLAEAIAAGVQGSQGGRPAGC